MLKYRFYLGILKLGTRKRTLCFARTRTEGYSFVVLISKEIPLLSVARALRRLVGSC